MAPVEKRWCPECKAMRVLEDEFAEDTGDSRTWVEEYWVEALECGHSICTTTREYPSSLRQATLPRAHYLPDPWA